MNIRENFYWGDNNASYAGRVSFRVENLEQVHDVLKVPFVLETSTTAGWFNPQWEVESASMKWHYDAPHYLFLEVFSTLAYQLLKAQEAMGINHNGRVILDAYDGNIVEYVKKPSEGLGVFDGKPRSADHFVLSESGTGPAPAEGRLARASNQANCRNLRRSLQMCGGEAIEEANRVEGPAWSRQNCQGQGSPCATPAPC